VRKYIRAYLHWLSALAALVLLAEAGTAQEQQKLEIVPQIPHSGVVDTVAFTHDGARAVSASWDGTLKLWDVATGRLIRSIYATSGTFSSVAFSPDASQLLAGEIQGVLTLFDAVAIGPAPPVDEAPEG